jgi:hypothetical protein
MRRQPLRVWIAYLIFYALFLILLLFVASFGLIAEA